MKKLKTITALSLVALLMASCGLQELDGGGKQTADRAEVQAMSVGLPSAQSKTWLDYSPGDTLHKVYWSDGDRINVNGQTSFPIAVPEGEGDNEAEFLLPKQDPPYRVVYPAEVVTEYTSDGTVTVELPQTQAYNPTSFASGAALMCAYAESLEAVTLQNLCAAIRVNITGTEGAIKSAELISLSGNAPLCGTFSLSPEEGKLTPVNGKNELSLHMETPVSVSKDGTDFFFVIPPGNYSEGLVFNFVNTDKVYMQNIWKPGGPLLAGELYSFNGTPYDAKFKVIETAEDWNEFAADMNAGKGDASRFVFKDRVVRLGANIDTKSLVQVTEDFPYVFDGGGFTITRREATKSLFKKVSGEIKALSLGGQLHLTASGAPFTEELLPGGKIIDCTNEMDVTFEFKDETTYVAAFAAVLSTNTTEGDITSTLSDCVNKGKIKGTTSYDVAPTDGAYRVAIGGIVGDVRAAGDKKVPYSVLLQNCRNVGEIKFTPISPSSHTQIGMGLTGIGGIAGTFRYAKKITIEDCDNSGAITLSAEQIKSENGMRAYSICLGGILGCGTESSGLGLLPDQGIDISLTDCDNTGTLYNCGDNYSTNAQGNNKVYTGGVAGSLVGLTETYATVSECSSKGDIFTYDLCSDDTPAPTVVSKRPGYNAVAGGFIGFGGYLDVDRCTLNCQIGNGKRQMLAWGGVIGYTVRPFTLKDCDLTLSGYFQRIAEYKWNRAVIAVVPDETTGSGAAVKPDVKGSKITGTLTVSGLVYTAGEIKETADKTGKNNLQSTLTTKLFTDVSKVKNNLFTGGKGVPVKGADGQITSYAQPDAESFGVEVTATVTYK